MPDPTTPSEISAAASILHAAADAIAAEYSWADCAARDMCSIADALTDAPSGGDRRIATKILDAARTALTTTGDTPADPGVDELLVVSHPHRVGGRPTIGHSRLMVGTIWELLAAGGDHETIRRGYPQVSAAALRVLEGLRADLTARDDEPDADGQVAHLVIDWTTPKALREALCLAQTALGLHPAASQAWTAIRHLGALAAQIDVHRPPGPDCKHGDRHTPTCGCEDPTPPADGREVAL